jgi:hypothetical protein
VGGFVAASNTPSMLASWLGSARARVGDAMKAISDSMLLGRDLGSQAMNVLSGDHVYALVGEVGDRLSRLHFLLRAIVTLSDVSGMGYDTRFLHDQISNLKTLIAGFEVLKLGIESRRDMSIIPLQLMELVGLHQFLNIDSEIGEWLKSPGK